MIPSKNKLLQTSAPNQALQVSCKLSGKWTFDNLTLARGWGKINF